MNTYPDKIGDPCLCAFPPCATWIGCKPPVAGACPSWFSTEELCCKQNEAINECDGTQVPPHISFKDPWDDLAIILKSGGETKSAHRCILPASKLSAYPGNADLIIPQVIAGFKRNVWANIRSITFNDSFIWLQQRPPVPHQ